MPIVNSALNLIFNSLQNNEFASNVLSKDMTWLSASLLRPILEMNHSPQSLKTTYKLLSFLTIRFPQTLIDKNADNILLTLVMMPYAFTNQHDHEVKTIMSSLASLTHDKSLKKELKKPLSGNAEIFCKPIMKLLLKNSIHAEDLKKLIIFYSSISVSLKEMFAPVVSICTTILSSINLKDAIEIFGEIGSIAIHDHDINRSTIILDFLSYLNGLNGVIKTPQMSKLMKKKMPNLHLSKPIDIDSWIPSENLDPFENVRDFPPLSIIDLDYIGVSFQKQLSVTVQQVKVEPFSTWTSALFQAESFTVQNDENAQKSITFASNAQYVFDLFTKALNGEFDEDIETTSSNHANILLQKMQSKEKMPQQIEIPTIPSNNLDASTLQISFLLVG